MTTTTYFVTRDSANALDTDEDRAMAHVSIGDFPTLEDAQTALRAYMIEETQWSTGKYVSPTSLRRAADILHAAQQQTGTLEPATDANWSKATISSRPRAWCSPSSAQRGRRHHPTRLPTAQGQGGPQLPRPAETDEFWKLSEIVNELDDLAQEKGWAAAYGDHPVRRALDALRPLTQTPL